MVVQFVGGVHVVSERNKGVDVEISNRGTFGVGNRTRCRYNNKGLQIE